MDFHHFPKEAFSLLCYLARCYKIGIMLYRPWVSSYLGHWDIHPEKGSYLHKWLTLFMPAEQWRHVLGYMSEYP